ncbi:MAG: ABC transporter ATP-binding protein [Syntrophomonadaceae bacterium]|jgi:putative ABC transport system ATP-binding protein|nr:ABC transporter ATP-binding protein [Syntrophomonadaceae bacterium]HQE23557.1 ABC transporter ATP-binding protein [Syntrophomonadaceae bacterium]
MLIELNNIYKNYGQGDNLVRALRGISLQVEDGEMVAIMGKSGSGKSTLLNIIGGLDTFDQGEYYYKGKKTVFKNQEQMARFRRNKIGFIMQNFALIEHKTVFDNVALPLRYNRLSRKTIENRVRQELSNMGLQDKAKRYPYQLSGGECQRVAIARALINEPELILADEPTGALDSNTEEEIMNILQDFNRRGKTIIIVTHDHNIATMCNRIINILDGKEVSA